jgi:hypothetical protein
LEDYPPAADDLRGAAPTIHDRCLSSDFLLAHLHLKTSFHLLRDETWLYIPEDYPPAADDQGWGYSTLS